MNQLSLLVLLLLSAPLWAEPEVLKRPSAGESAAWETLKFEEIDSKPDTLAGYGIRDTFGGEVAIVKTFLWLGDTSPIQSGSTGTIWWPNKGSVRGMECDVMSAPRGGDIVMDLLVGEPLVSVYPSEGNPKILEGTTTTLTHTPEALAEQVPIEKRDRMQVKVVSAPVVNYSVSIASVGELPIEPSIGTRILVFSDGHVWEGRDYGASYTDLGLVAGLTGAVATVVDLPAEASAGAKYLVYADNLVYTKNADTTWTNSGTLTISGIWDGNTTDTVSLLTWPTPPGSTFLTLDTGHIWRNDYAIWTDSGLPDSSGLGLSCNVYVYNLPNDD